MQGNLRNYQIIKLYLSRRNFQWIESPAVILHGDILFMISRLKVFCIFPRCNINLSCNYDPNND